MVLDSIGVIADGDKVQMILLLNEQPFVLFDAETVYKIKRIVFMSDIHILDDLATHTNVVNFILTQPYDNFLFLLLTLDNGNAKKAQILLHLVSINEMSMVINYPIML